MKRKFWFRQGVLALLLVAILAFVGYQNQPHDSDSDEGAVPCSIYSGIVMAVAPGRVQLWHGPFCSITVVYASRWYTCQPGEYYTGFTCPENGGGGGGSW